MIRRTLIGVIAGVALMGATAGGAFASTQTVTQAIKAQDKLIHANPTYKSLKGFKIETVAEAQKAIPKFEALQKLMTNAATSVAAASATAGQKTAQKDWVTGVRTVAKGLGYFITELTDVVHNNKTAAKAAAVKAVKLIDAGNVIGTKGDRLLGLPTND